MNSYRTAGVAIAAALTISAGTPPDARPRQPTHDIAWYAAHPDARLAMIRKCNSDTSFSHSTECANAQTGGTRVWSQDAWQRAMSVPFPRIGRTP